MKYWQEGEYRIPLKNQQELELMRQSGRILGLTLSEVEKAIRPGLSTAEINAIAENIILAHEAIPAFKGYQGFPAATCIAINEEVVHGIPGDRLITTGDLVTVDCGVSYKGMITDSAITVGVGRLSEEHEKLLRTVQKALDRAIEIARPGLRVTELSKIIEKTVKKEGFAIVEELSGHGVGFELHEDPYIFNFYNGTPGPLLQVGMTLAIEPIITLGSPKTRTLADKWTIVTKDGRAAVQAEHTIAITEKGCEILTKRPK